MYPITAQETVALYVATLNHKVKCQGALEDAEKEVAKRPDSVYALAYRNICKTDYEKAQEALSITLRILHTCPK